MNNPKVKLSFDLEIKHLFLGGKEIKIELLLIYLSEQIIMLSL